MYITDYLNCYFGYDRIVLIFCPKRPYGLMEELGMTLISAEEVCC